MLPIPFYIQDSGNLTLTKEERYFLDNIRQATCLVDWDEPGLSYEYNMMSLCELEGKYYLFQTTGCSCPSPEETWSLVVNGSQEVIEHYLGNASQLFVNEVRKVPGWGKD